jgi:glycosyltransferase involved in cell wall biosynthesis
MLLFNQLKKKNSFHEYSVNHSVQFLVERILYLDAYSKLTFNLIIASLDRTNDLDRLFSSLKKQTYTNFKCIVIDQNLDDRLSSIIEKYIFSFPIIHLNSVIGLSRARNVGLKYLDGDIIAFPDDDCWYSDQLLEKIADLFREHSEWDGISGIVNSGSQAPSVYKWDQNKGAIRLTNVWKRGTSASLFLRHRIIDMVGQFDEDLGVGSGTIWGSAEDIDYIIRSIKEDAFIYYSPELVVFHPDHIPDYRRADLMKAYFYAAGMGRVLRKHNYSWVFVLGQLVKSVGSIFKSIAGLNFARAKYFWYVLRGRWTGWSSKTKVI